MPDHMQSEHDENICIVAIAQYDMRPSHIPMTPLSTMRGIPYVC